MLSVLVDRTYCHLFLAQIVALLGTGIATFALGLLAYDLALDSMKAKHLERALMQFAEGGAAKMFKPAIGSGFIVVVGPLQFEVLASRIERDHPDVTPSATKEMMV